MLARLFAKLSIIVLPALFVSSSFAQTTNPLTKKYSPADLKKDASVLVEAIQKIHPVIGIYESEKYYSTLFSNYINSITDSLTEKEFRLKTKLVIEKLHCAHTDMMYSKKYLKKVKKTKYNFPRYYLLPVHDTIFVLAGLNKKYDTILKPGDVITKLNGVPADSFYHFAQNYITMDGHIKEGKNLYAQLGYSAYYLLLLNYPDTITYEYMRKGAVKTFKSPTLNTLNIPSYSLSKRDDSLFTKYKRAKIRYRYLDESKKTMHLHLQAFSGNKFTKAYRKIFRQLEKNKTENLIIDLRFNGGGSLTNTYMLLKYLMDTLTTQTSYTKIKKYPLRKYTRGNMIFRFTKGYFTLFGQKTTRGDTDSYTMKIKPQKKNHYSNKIYVLINGGSFSASCVVSEYLKATNRATFIGRETGGTAEGCNAVIMPKYTLPNTKTKIRIPTFRLIHDVNKNGNTGRGIMPDYETDYSFKDLILKRDLEMELVEKLISKKL